MAKWEGGWRGACVAALAVGLAVAAGCERREGYSQATPEETLRSAVEMVKKGEARKLPRLIYADAEGFGKEFRSVLGRLGILMGSLQSLGKTVAEKFPAEVAELRKQAEESAAGQAQTILGRLGGAGAGGPPGRVAVPQDPAARRRQQGEFEDVVKQLFADPFGWLEANAARLGTVAVDDERAAVTLDGQPIAGGLVGMRVSEGKWYVELPTHLVEAYMPRSREEWSIAGSALKMADRVVRDLEKDLQEGKIRRLDALASKAGEKAFVPGVMIVAAYVNEMDVRRQRERLVGEFRKRYNAWKATMEGNDAEALATLAAVTERLAGRELDAVVRQRRADRGVKRPDFAALGDDEFIDLMQGWWRGAGAAVSIRGGLNAEQVRAAAETVEKSLAAPRRRG